MRKPEQEKNRERIQQSRGGARHSNVPAHFIPPHDSNNRQLLVKDILTQEGTKFFWLFKVSIHIF